MLSQSWQVLTWPRGLVIDWQRQSSAFVQPVPPVPSAWNLLTFRSVIDWKKGPPSGRPFAQLYAPEVHAGPPVIGAPWGAPRFTVSPPLPRIAPVAVAAPKVAPLYAPEITRGPPIPGSPWHGQFPAPTLPSAPPVIVLPPLPGAAVGSTLRVQKDPEAKQRTRLHMDIVADILNSLIRQGVLLNTGVQQWAFLPPAAVPSTAPVLYTGRGPPVNPFGKKGDYYLDLASGKFYQQT